MSTKVVSQGCKQPSVRTNKYDSSCVSVRWSLTIAELAFFVSCNRHNIGLIEHVRSTIYDTIALCKETMAAQRAVHSVPDIVEATFRAAVADQEDVLSLSALGKLLADLGRYGEAEAIFEKILLGCNNSASPEGRSDDDARALAMGWYAAMVEKNGSEGATKAEALYKGALRINEKDPLAMGNYAVFLHRVKRDHAVSWKLPLFSHQFFNNRETHTHGRVGCSCVPAALLLVETHCLHRKLV